MLTGVPSVFVRTSGCNLRCVWCDTPYTSWAPEGREMSVEEIVGECGRTAARHVVVTGGEPMIAPEIGALTASLRAVGLHITIETAGTVFTEVACDLMSVSPKLANSTPYKREEGRWVAQHERLRRQPAVVRRLMEAHPYQLKFVIAAPEDIEEAAALVHEVGGEALRVVLMPEGTTSERLRERGLWLAEICKERGWRFGSRLHVELWGDRRGV